MRVKKIPGIFLTANIFFGVADMQSNQGCKRCMLMACFYINHIFGWFPRLSIFQLLTMMRQKPKLLFRFPPGSCLLRKNAKDFGTYLSAKVKFRF
jgi:hypothetical protein